MWNPWPIAGLGWGRDFPHRCLTLLAKSYSTLSASLAWISAAAYIDSIHKSASPATLSLRTQHTLLNHSQFLSVSSDDCFGIWIHPWTAICRQIVSRPPAHRKQHEHILLILKSLSVA